MAQFGYGNTLMEDPNGDYPDVPAQAPVPAPAGPGAPAPPIDPVTGDVRPGHGGGGWNAGMPGAGGPDYRLTPAPRFDPGANFVPPEFQRPTMADAQNEPGYQFRLQAGNDALQRSAAARGVLRTGGTLRDIVEYGQNFGSEEYGQTFNRALQGYDRQFQGAKSAYDAQYQGRKDRYAPEFATWQSKDRAEQARAMAAYQREWEMYQFGHQGHGGGGGGGGYQGEPPPDPTSNWGTY